MGKYFVNNKVLRPCEGFFNAAFSACTLTLSAERTTRESSGGRANQ